MAAISASARAVLEVLDAQEFGTRRAVMAMESGLAAQAVTDALVVLLYHELVSVSSIHGACDRHASDLRTWTINDAGREALQALRRAEDRVFPALLSRNATRFVFVRPVAFGSREAMRSYFGRGHDGR